nr:MAG TPA: hypothetical protein [Caudoviricetes sp.]
MASNQISRAVFVESQCNSYLLPVKKNDKGDLKSLFELFTL